LPVKIQVLWDMTTCQLVNWLLMVRTSLLSLFSKWSQFIPSPMTLTMEAASSPWTSQTNPQSTLRHCSEDCDVHYLIHKTL
jgi:hypothetical protein